MAVWSISSQPGRAVVAVSALVFLAGAPVVAQQPSPRPGQAAGPQAPGPALALSMEQAVAMALETNLGLKRDRVDLSLAAQGIAAARAAYNPALQTTFTRNTSESQPVTFTDSTTTSRSAVQVSSSWRQNLPWYGGGYSVSWSGSRSTTTTSLPTFNPNLGSTLSVSFIQPLWRGLRTDGNRVGLESAERGSEIADLQLQQRVLQTQDQVRGAYLNLIGAIQSLDVARQNKRVNDDALRNARAKIAVGTAAEIDAIQSEAAVLTSEEAVIVAEARVSAAEDQLRALILDTTRPDYWQVRLEPTDEIQIAPREIDVEAAVRNALAGRLDLIQARRALDITGLNVRLNEDSIRPQVDFTANYSASAIGGTQFQYGAGFPPPVVATTARSFGSVLGDTFGGAFPSWTFGVTVGYPIGQTAAEAALARARLQQSQQEIDIRNLELAIAAQVRDAARQVQSNYRRVLSTQAALEANEKQLSAEERKLAVGMSTTFDVLLKQSLLAAARTQALNARLAYAQALITFERVQRIR